MFPHPVAPSADTSHWQDLFVLIKKAILKNQLDPMFYPDVFQFLPNLLLQSTQDTTLYLIISPLYVPLAWQFVSFRFG